jgi:hypothetical protein
MSALSFANARADWPAMPAAQGRGVDIDGTSQDRAFVALRAAYRASGGILCGDDLARCLEDHGRGDFAWLAGLIVSGEVFSFDWHHRFWLPMFQFDAHDLSTRQAPRQVLARLSTEFDGWELAWWFAEPHARLNHRRPVDLLDSNLHAVLDAADADRRTAADSANR